MIAAFIFFRIIKSCKSRTGAAEPGAGADFACTLPGPPVRAGIYCEAKIIQAAPTAKFIWRLWPCGLFSGEIGARTAYLRPVLSSCSPPPCPVSSHAESLPSSAMSVPFGTPLLSRPIAAIGLPAALPCIVSRPGLFPDIRPVSTLLMTDYPLLYLPCPGIPFLGIRPSPSLLVPSCPVSSLLCIPCFRPRPCRSFFWEAGDFGMKMRNTSLFGK